jgi:leucyl-tRNA synthetase
MRWALADAGDGMDDANFETTTANAAILRLTKDLAWIEEVLGPAGGAADCLLQVVCGRRQNTCVHVTRCAHRRATDCSPLAWSCTCYAHDCGVGFEAWVFEA